MIIHEDNRVFSFEQKPWLETYILFTRKWKTGMKMKFEQKFWKVLNKAFYGEQWKMLGTDKN